MTNRTETNRSWKLPDRLTDAWIDRRTESVGDKGAGTDEVTYAHFHRHKPWLHWVCSSSGVCPGVSKCESCNIVCSPLSCSWANSINSHSPPWPSLYCQAMTRHWPEKNTAHRVTHVQKKCEKEEYWWVWCRGEIHCVCGHMFRCALEQIKSICRLNTSGNGGLHVCLPFTCSYIVRVFIRLRLESAE